jgi:hypothetical protein
MVQYIGPIWCWVIQKYNLVQEEYPAGLAVCDGAPCWDVGGGAEPPLPGSYGGSLKYVIFYFAPRLWGLCNFHLLRNGGGVLKGSVTHAPLYPWILSRKSNIRVILLRERSDSLTSLHHNVCVVYSLSYMNKLIRSYYSWCCLYLWTYLLSTIMYLHILRHY